MHDSTARGSGPAKIRCKILSNFTAQPIEKVFRYWANARAMSIDLQFAPYDQVFQSLVNIENSGEERGVNYVVVVLQLERWLGTADLLSREVTERVRALARLILEKAESSGLNVLVCLTPVSSEVKEAEGIIANQKFLQEEFRVAESVLVLETADLLRHFTSTNYEELFDLHLGRLADVSYSPAGLALIATAIARWLHVETAPAKKVIVVDCDNTLWSGVLSEEGAEGIRIDERHSRLQRFLKAQVDEGKLLCLSSKNDEDAVMTLIGLHPGMLLKKEHLAAWRINWRPKAENIQSLSDELNLGINSFVFIDDDSFECEAMRKTQPSVLTIQISKSVEEPDTFLRLHWEFDTTKRTGRNGQSRTQMYHQERKRNLVRGKAVSMEDFIVSLGVTVRWRSVGLEDISRAVELTERTNQFNLNGRRLSRAEILSCLKDSECNCEILNVSDRYGAYGDVGLIVARKVGRTLQVETLVLSCRALGRGVEEQLIRRIVSFVSERGLNGSRLAFRPTGKNHLVNAFIETNGLGVSGDEAILL